MSNEQGQRASGPEAHARFPIRIGWVWRVPLLIIGVTRKRAWLELEEDALVVKYTYFHERIPYTSVASAGLMSWKLLYGIGMRPTPDGTLGLVGSRKGVVRMRFEESRPVTYKVPFEMDFTGVAFSLDEPEVFLSALRARL